RCPDETVAGGRRGVGLKSATDGEDGPFQFGRDTLGDMMVGSRQIIETLGSGSQIAVPPFVEPGLGAAQSQSLHSGFPVARPVVGHAERVPEVPLLRRQLDRFSS